MPERDYNSFSEMFRNAFVDPEESKHKSYDEILEEYEEFFSLDEELRKKEG